MTCITSVEIVFCIWFLVRAVLEKSWKNRYLAAVFLMISDAFLMARYLYNDGNTISCSGD